MRYLEIEDYFEFIFDAIRKVVYDDIQKPCYEKESRGINNLKCILEIIKNNQYYPTYYKKSAYLLTALSTGHYFSNGNKRIAIFSFAMFEDINGYKSRSIRKNIYTEWFKKHFSNYILTPSYFPTNYAWAFYNFSRAINIKREEDPSQGHEYNFNQIKKLTEKFIMFTSVKRSFRK